MDSLRARTNVVVFGEVDMASAPGLEAMLLDCVLRGARHLEVDLENVSFMDSSMLKVLLRVREEMAEHSGRVLVRCTRQKFVRLFRFTGTEELLDVRTANERPFPPPRPSDTLRFFDCDTGRAHFGARPDLGRCGG